MKTIRDSYEIYLQIAEQESFAYIKEQMALEVEKNGLQA
jgi:hypothetical protein